MSQAFERANKRSLDRTGRDATLVNQTGTGSRDDHGHPIWGDRVETDVSTEILYQGEHAFNRRADGIDDEIDIIAFVEKPETYVYGDGTYGDGPMGGTYVTDGSHDDETRATRIEEGGASYVVRDVFDENNGQLRVHGEKED